MDVVQAQIGQNDFQAKVTTYNLVSKQTQKDCYTQADKLIEQAKKMMVMHSLANFGKRRTMMR